MSGPKKKPRPARIDFRVSVRVELQSRLQEFYSRNLGRGGIYLEVTNDPPPIGAAVHLSFEVPDLHKMIEADAKVIHHHTYDDLDGNMRKTTKTGIGLSFSNLDKKDEEMIHEYVTGKELRLSR